MEKLRKWKSRALVIVTLFCMMAMMMPGSAVATGTFTDTSGHWAKDTIESWVGQGFVSGYPDDTFKPDQNITRAEFMTLVNKAFGFTKTTPANYTDVEPGAWYQKTIAVAKAAGYISGYPDSTMRPDNPISREEAASIIMRLKNLAPDQEAVSQFTDAAKMTWSKGAVGAVAEAGIMQGYPEGSFQPQRFITRAEAIVALDAALKYSAADPDTPAEPEDPVTPEAPEVTANDATNKVNGMNTDMEYKLDDGRWVSYDAEEFADLDLSGKHTLLVRYAEEGNNPASPATTLKFTSPGGGGGGGGSLPALSVIDIAAPNATSVTFTSDVAGASVTWNGEELRDVTTVIGENTITVPAMTSAEPNTLMVKKSGYKSFTANDVIWYAPPVISNVSISSNNEKNQTVAWNGHIITLTFTANEPVEKLSNFKINSSNPDTFTSDGNNNYTATHLVDAGDLVTGQPVTFQINVVNVYGKYSQTIEATNDGSSVMIVGVAELVPTETAGIINNHVYAGYQIMFGEEQISLAADNVNMIVVLEPGQTIVQFIIPDADPLLWFNVEKAAGEYLYAVNTIEGKPYMTKFNWAGLQTATLAPTGAAGEHEGITYVEYEMLDASLNKISLAADAVKLIAQKNSAGDWVALEPNTDTTLWFNEAKAAGEYTYIVITTAGITYNATLTWIETPSADQAVSATAVIVGQQLSSSILSGTFKNVNSEAVPGTLAWDAPNTIVNASGNFAWTFTPTDNTAYKTVTGTANVTANPPPTYVTTKAVTYTSTDAILNGTNGEFAAQQHKFWISYDTSTFDTSSATPPYGIKESSLITGTTAGENFSCELDSIAGFTPQTGLMNYFMAWSQVGDVWYPGEILTFYTQAAYNVTLTPSQVSLSQGQLWGGFQAGIATTGGASDALIWSSSDDGVNDKVTVDQYGWVTVAADAAPGDYTITITSAFDNTQSASATITVISEITGFDAIDNVIGGNTGAATYADAAAVQANLPANVTANSGAVTVPVTSWTDTDSYDPNTAGSYTFTAVLGTIPAGYVNTGGYTATVEVVIAAVGTDASLAYLNYLIGETYTLVPGFDPDTLSYDVILPAGTTWRPAVSCEANDANATVAINHSIVLPGTTTFTVTAEDGKTKKTYSINFTVADTEITGFVAIDNVIGGNAGAATYADAAAVIAHLNTNITAVTIIGTTLTAPVSNWTATDTYTAAEGSYTFTATIGDLPDGYVDAVDPITSVSVEVVIGAALGTDASLSALAYNFGTGITPVPGFAADTQTYNIPLPSGTTQVPSINFTKNDAKASVLLNNPADLPGTTTITVTAENGITTKIYTINFTVEVPDLDLTGAAINVAAGTITGTTTAMEYSLDSMDGDKGTWTDCTAGSTAVTFDEGAVYVREKARTANFRLLATIASAAGAPVSGVTYNIAAKTVTGLGTAYEYSLNGAAWSTTASGVEFTAGPVTVRIKATTTALPSAAQTIATIAPAPAAPPAPNAKTITYFYISFENAAHEFSINEGLTWQDGAAYPNNTFIDLSPSTTYYFIARVKATATTLASEPSEPASITTSVSGSTKIKINGVSMTWTYIGDAVGMKVGDFIATLSSEDGSTQQYMVSATGIAPYKVSTDLVAAWDYLRVIAEDGVNYTTIDIIS